MNELYVRTVNPASSTWAVDELAVDASQVGAISPLRPECRLARCRIGCPVILNADLLSDTVGLGRQVRYSLIGGR